MSVTDPSPDLGWRGRERASLERRGTPELALCLAVVHHVCITGNVPVREFLDWLRSLDTALVIEFPDREDPMVQRLLGGKREGSNPDYERAAFERALAERFTIERSAAVSETRTLYEARPRVSGSIGFRRAALHLGGLWALAFAQPLLDLLGPQRASSSSRAGARPATSCCSRSATRWCRRWRGRRSSGAWAGSGRRSGWGAMLVLVGAARRRAGCCRRSATCSAARRSAMPGRARARRRRRGRCTPASPACARS